jgi:hypothetical protein
MVIESMVKQRAYRSQHFEVPTPDEGPLTVIQ